MVRFLTIKEFVEDISSVSDEQRLFTNPYRDEVCKYNLLNYLQHLKSNKVDIMLIGEAPGYRGCALTGIPFTDEIQLTYPENNYAINRIVKIPIQNNSVVVPIRFVCFCIPELPIKII